MVQTWGTADRGEVSCEKCGAVYKVTVHRFPMRDKDYFDCNDCGHRMASWNDTEVPSYRQIKKGNPAS